MSVPFSYQINLFISSIHSLPVLYYKRSLFDFVRSSDSNVLRAVVTFVSISHVYDYSRIFVRNRTFCPSFFHLGREVDPLTRSALYYIWCGKNRMAELQSAVRCVVFHAAVLTGFTSVTGRSTRSARVKRVIN